MASQMTYGGTERVSDLHVAGTRQARVQVQESLPGAWALTHTLTRAVRTLTFCTAQAEQPGGGNGT